MNESFILHAGLAFDRPRKMKSEPTPAQLTEEKDKYIKEARQFAFSLVEALNNPDGLLCFVFWDIVAFLHSKNLEIYVLKGN